MIKRNKKKLKKYEEINLKIQIYKLKLNYLKINRDCPENLEIKNHCHVLRIIIQYTH